MTRRICELFSSEIGQIQWTIFPDGFSVVPCVRTLPTAHVATPVRVRVAQLFRVSCA